MTDGEKSMVIRMALHATRNSLPDTAHDPRHALLVVASAPSMVLAALYDEIKKQEGK